MHLGRRVEWMADEDLTVLACDQACVGESGCDAAVQEPHGLDLAVAQIRKRGAQRVVVIGASAGGPRAIAVAADPPEGVVAVVALSPARAWDQAPAVGPLLIVADPADSSVDEDQVRAAVEEAPTLVTYVSAPGEGHAQQLLYDVDDGPSKVRSQVMGFVKTLRP